MGECTIVAYDFDGNAYVFSCLPFSMALAIKDLLEDMGLDVSYEDRAAILTKDL